MLHKKLIYETTYTHSRYGPPVKTTAKPLSVWIHYFISLLFNRCVCHLMNSVPFMYVNDTVARLCSTSVCSEIQRHDIDGRSSARIRRCLYIWQCEREELRGLAILYGIVLWCPQMHTPFAEPSVHAQIQAVWANLKSIFFMSFFNLMCSEYKDFAFLARTLR